jgi:hypothetical protein
LKTIVYTALAISLVGALLDFASGNSFNPMMGGGMGASYDSAVALYVLGAVVLIAGVLPFLPNVANRMSWFGLLMEIFGVTMVLASGWIPGMNIVLSDAMLVVGALMILNGALMQRGNKTQMK